jgi:hypothetical protein
MSEAYYFSFGRNHAHPDCLLRIEGTREEARNRMFVLHGTKWAFQYDEAKGLEIADKYNLQVLHD